MNRPLSKEERSKYAEFLGDGTDDRCFLNQQWAQRLLAAHDFWREAVKNAPEFDRESGQCLWCDVQAASVTHQGPDGKWHPDDHKPDCCWLLAQEG